jgi:hypothetical protein
VLHKLDERYINDTALVQWLLGDNGRFPKMSIQDIRKKLIAEVREAYECQGVTVPPFIKVLELLPENVVLPEYPCQNQNCGQGKAHHTLAEAKACGQQQPPADQDDRVVVDYKDIKENEDYLEEIVGLIKDWGWGNWAIIWKRATLFKANDRLCSGTTRLTDKNKSSTPIKKYCGRKQIDFELLTNCSGIKFGCLCNLH